MADLPYRPPAKRVASGALLLDAADRVLLVNPTYKPEWEIPGGLVEENEPPRRACQREVEEEIGLLIEPGRLLSLDYRPASSGKMDMLRFVFWGGRLTDAQVDAIRLDEDELSEWGLFTVDEVRQRLSPSLGEVIAVCLDLLTGDTTQYVEFT